MGLTKSIAELLDGDPKAFSFSHRGRIVMEGKVLPFIPIGERKFTIEAFQSIGYDLVGTLDFSIIDDLVVECSNLPTLCDSPITTDELSDYVTELINCTWCGMLDLTDIEDGEPIDLVLIWDTLHKSIDIITSIVCGYVPSGDITYFIDIKQRLFIFGGKYNV